MAPWFFIPSAPLDRSAQHYAPPDLTRFELTPPDPTQHPRAAIKSNAMAAVLFDMSDDVKSNIAAFAKADSVNLLELSLTAEETVALASSHTLDAAGLRQIGPLISATEPRFLLLRYQKDAETLAAEAGGLFNSQAATFFIYSCPETASLRLKMTYSTAKVRHPARSCSTDIRILFVTKSMFPPVHGHCRSNHHLRAVLRQNGGGHSHR